MPKCLHMEHYTGPAQEKPKMKSSAENPEASGEVDSKETALAQIKEKEAVRASLMKSWKTKFDAIREAKKENDRHKEVITRLHMSGKLSAEDYQAELASNQEKLDADLREAQKDLDLATEYREEIEKLQASIDESTN